MRPETGPGPWGRIEGRAEHPLSPISYPRGEVAWKSGAGLHAGPTRCTIGSDGHAGIGPPRGPGPPALRPERAGRPDAGWVRAAPGTARDGHRRGQRAGGRRGPAGRGGDGHGQDARLPRAGRARPPARPRLDRHEEPAGADLLQGPSGARRGGQRALHRHLHEGPRQLPLPPSIRGGAARPGGPGRGRRVHPRPRPVVPRHRNRRPGRDRGAARGPAVLGRRGRLVGQLPRLRVSPLRRLLRHQDAPEGGRLRPGHRQPPPPVRGRLRAPGRLRRGDPRVPVRGGGRGSPARGRGHPVLRHGRRHLPGGRTGA